MDFPILHKTNAVRTYLRVERNGSLTNYEARSNQPILGRPPGRTFTSTQAPSTGSDGGNMVFQACVLDTLCTREKRHSPQRTHRLRKQDESSDRTL